MDNNQFIKLVTKYLSKETSLKEVEELNSYLKDAEYKEIFELMITKWEAPKEVINSGNFNLERGLDNLRNKINYYEPVYRKSEIHKKRVRTFQQFVIKAAASIAFITLIAYGFYYFLFSNNIAKPNIEYVEKITEPGQKSIITFIDGTKIILNSGSSLKYPTRFEKNRRFVVLSGEAYFEVTHNAARPFIVSTRNIETTVLGTKFDVKAFPDENEISVSLVEGEVMVENTVNEKNTESIVLSENERLCYNENDKSMELSSFNLMQTIGWKDNILVFKDEPLIKVLTVIERSYGVKIELADTSLNYIKVTANFASESFWTIVKALKVFTKLDYKTVSNNEELTKVIFYKMKEEGEKNN